MKILISFIASILAWELLKYIIHRKSPIYSKEIPDFKYTSYPPPRPTTSTTYNVNFKYEYKQ